LTKGEKMKLVESESVGKVFLLKTSQPLGGRRETTNRRTAPTGGRKSLGSLLLIGGEIGGINKLGGATFMKHTKSP